MKGDITNTDRYHAEVILYLIAIAVYFMQGTVYPPGSLLSKSMLVIVLGISFLSMIRLFGHITAAIYKIYLVLFLFFTLAIFVSPNIVGINKTDHLKGIYLSLLSFFPALFYSRENALSPIYLLYFLIIMTFVEIGAFNYYLYNYNIASTIEYSTGEITNNIGYRFVYLFPLVFFINKKWVQGLLVITLLYFVLLSAKRGAIICGLACSIFYLLFILKSLNRKSFMTALIICIVVFAAMFFLYNSFENNEYLIRRFESVLEGESSQRDVIYSNLFNYLKTSLRPFTFLFGAGYGATTKISETGNFAHNDWLEIAVDFGLLGFILYLSLFVILLIIYKRNKNVISNLTKYSFLCVIFIQIITSCISMSFMDEGHVFVTFATGIIINRVYNEQRSFQS